MDGERKRDGKGYVANPRPLDEIVEVFVNRIRNRISLVVGGLPVRVLEEIIEGENGWQQDSLVPLALS